METRNVTAEERYRLYRLCECTTCEGTGKERYDDGSYLLPTGERCPDCRGEGRIRDLVATATDPESLGVALVTLAREGEFTECPIGILEKPDGDDKPGTWLVKPWGASPRQVSDAARVLARSKGKT